MGHPFDEVTQYVFNEYSWLTYAHESIATLQIAFSAKIIWAVAAGFTRLSLLSFYYRLVRDSRLKWFRAGIHISGNR
jgi:hypothetical protein